MNEKPYFSALPVCEDCGSFISGKPWLVGLNDEDRGLTLEYRLCSKACGEAVIRNRHNDVKRNPELNITIAYLRQAKSSVLSRTQLVKVELSRGGNGQQQKVVFMKARKRRKPAFIGPNGLSVIA